MAATELWRIPSAVLQALMRFHDTETLVVARCNDLIQRDVFPSTAFLDVLVHIGARAIPAAIFNRPVFLNKLTALLQRALEYVHVCGAVVLWCLRDAQVAKWWARVVQDPASDEMPFGVLEAEHYELVATPTRRGSVDAVLHAEYVGDEQPRFARKHRMVVWAPSLRVVPLEQRVLAESIRYVAADSMVAAVTTTAGMRRPTSRFYEVMDLLSALKRAQRNIRDADFNRAHPHVVVQTELPTGARGDGPVTPLEMNQNLFLGSDSFRDAVVNMRIGHASVALDAAHDQLQRMRLAAGGLDALENGGGMGGRATMRTRIRDEQHVPDALDDVFELPPMNKLVSAPVASTADDIPRRMMHYTAYVASLFNLPLVFLQDAVVAGTPGAHFNRDATNRAVLEETVERRRQLANDVFAFAFTATFREYTAARLDDVAQRAAADARAVLEDGEISDVLTAASALKSVAGQVTASLQFEPQPTVKSLNNMEIAMRLVPTGMVAPAELERAIEAATGVRIRLRNPPEVPTPAAPRPEKRGREEEGREDRQDRDKRTRTHY